MYSSVPWYFRDTKIRENESSQCFLDPHIPAQYIPVKKSGLRQLIVQNEWHWFVRFVVYLNSIIRTNFGQIPAIDSRDSLHTRLFSIYNNEFQSAGVTFN